MQVDRSTTFFTRVTMTRQVKNSIMRILDENGIQLHSLEAMKNNAIEYFTTLLDCQPCRHPIPELNLKFLGTIAREISAYLRHFLCMDVIEFVLFNIARKKALGPDGITVETLYHHWGHKMEDFLVQFYIFSPKRHMITPLIIHNDDPKD